MNILIIGAGRMGLRHLTGVLSITQVNQITVLDINSEALKNAKDSSNGDNRVVTYLLSDFTPSIHDICIIASTANNRNSLIDLAISCQCQHLLIEKPIGQSYDEVNSIIQYVNNKPIKAYVNLNMRLYPCYMKLKEDLSKTPQLKGNKTITINTGTIGIGCNGIHYIDMLYYLFDADHAQIIHSEIDSSIIPSGRGAQFCDYGGWSIMKFYKENNYLGKALISMASDSSAFGGWEIISPNGRVLIDEIAGQRKTVVRKLDSQMPIYRYAADYLKPELETFEAPFLGDLTKTWILKLIEDGTSVLPELSESISAHKTMFEWLGNKDLSKKFPIT